MYGDWFKTDAGISQYRFATIVGFVPSQYVIYSVYVNALLCRIFILYDVIGAPLSTTYGQEIRTISLANDVVGADGLDGLIAAITLITFE